MAIRDLGSRGQTVNMIDPAKIKIKPGFNARDMESVAFKKRVQEIAASIEARGFLQSEPIEIFRDGDETFVSSGHTRLSAAWEVQRRGNVELLAIPCLNEAKGTTPLDRELNKVIANSGERLSLAEEGRVFSRALSLGSNIAEIAARCGRSVTHVNNALEFLSAPQEAHQLVREGKVSPSLAAKTVRDEGGERGVAKLKEAVAKAKSNGKAKARPRDVASVEKQVSAPARPNAGKAAFDLVKRMAKLKNPEYEDFDTEIRRFAELIDEAKEIARGL